MAIGRGNCGQAIQEMETYLSAWPEPHTADKLLQLKGDYDMMTAYWRQGGEDPERTMVYAKLMQRMYVLWANVNHYHRMRKSPYQHSLYTRVRQHDREWSLKAIRQEMEDFVSNSALLQLEPEQKRKDKSMSLHRAHRQQMHELFEYVLTSRQWTDSVGQHFVEMLVSPTLDANDQQLLVSAITLSLMSQFDMAKFQTLVEVYRSSQDDAVRQRALVGWVLGHDDLLHIVYPEQHRLIVALTADETVCRELTELQMQLVYTLNADKDMSTIQKEIMPDLMKNNLLHMAEKSLEEQEEDALEEVLHPDAAEERMEQLESSFNRMMDMQRQGSDIYFGSFSQMKRFPYFYDISNWLVPFYMEHPDIASVVAEMGDNRFVNKMLRRGPFCNSDKYSFVLGFRQVLGQLPEHMREMLKRGEATMGELEEDELQTPAFQRRAYLMDLYRFFRLFSHRSELHSPFETGDREMGDCEFFSSPLFGDTPLEASKGTIVRLLKKNHLTQSANRLLDTFQEPYRDVQYYLWKEDYDQVLLLDPHHEKALLGLARQAFQQKRYDQALEKYDALLALRPEKSGYLINKAVCLVQMERYEEAQKLLFRMNYEHPENENTTRVLAWSLMCNGKMEQAARFYQTLCDKDAPDAEDLLNQGYCLWLQGLIDSAADSIRRYVTINKSQHPDFQPHLEEEWLLQRGLTHAEVMMMETLACS